MKTSLVITIALVTVFTISEISCGKTCMQYNDKCVKNSDCCSNNCYSADHENGYCMNPINAVFKVENGSCSYNESFHKESGDDKFKFIGINAAHTLLPVGSDIQITNTVNNKTLDVTINDFFQLNNETLLQLSKEAADRLNVKDGETIPCSIHLYKPKPDYSKARNMFVFSASFFVVLYLILTYV